MCNDTIMYRNRIKYSNFIMKLDFITIENSILNSDAKIEFKQASILLIRNAFNKAKEEYSKIEGNVKLSLLIDFEDKDISNAFEVWLKGYIDFQTTVLPDTKELYNTDTNFKALCKAEKLAKRAKNDYIAKNKLKLKQ